MSLEDNQYFVEEFHRGEWIAVNSKDEKGNNKPKSVWINEEVAAVMNFDKDTQGLRYVLAKNDPIDEMTVKELKAYAEENGIDIGEATKKEDIKEIIKNN